MKNHGGVGKQAGKQGFTLIEVLIVVVIIGVLAALIIPRFMSQPENAMIGGAHQMLGALRRAQQTYMDTRGSSTGLLFDCVTGTPAVCNATALTSLGLQPINQKEYVYYCASDAAGEFCAGHRTAGTYVGAYASLRYLATGGTPDATVTCGSGYVVSSNPSVCRTA